MPSTGWVSVTGWEDRIRTFLIWNQNSIVIGKQPKTYILMPFVGWEKANILIANCSTPAPTRKQAISMKRGRSGASEPRKAMVRPCITLAFETSAGETGFPITVTMLVLNG